MYPMEAVAAISGVAEVAPNPGARVGTDFSTALASGLSRVDVSLRAADAGVRALAAGEGVALHDVMITMERARMELTLAVEVRNRLVEAYQELARMQL
ncbi:flagellar hook-basal body complex protein FliE [Arenimonas terrae]|uniref:Flagellar hook-basal body complex protein FliE n=1 Tax=Arenimonas terrae TaxID=2546226 RepID=A0A5C4RRQ9_9GAMM|nr:flagellar hook-basal body complex protein FliE [Arenimonas terrae]TNJ33237.1 flagellar hook-basal body complex protein FliE [Arenimonas terrae]